ncbi:MAG: pyruvate dehydrogenase complex dihydrolipoamide acetyltransferase [Pseudolabrys sp.]|nr:pyruvate dehydrogenase complex dihydrolipoamide acetyltransferase [Pseudolabrys sp.]
MPTNILMPALSPTMEKGNLAKWLKKEGDKIKSGDVIAEIETDKATMEYEAVDEGTLAKIVVPEGTQDVAVNAVIAVMVADGEDAKAASATAPKTAAPAAKAPEAAKPQPAPPKAVPSAAPAAPPAPAPAAAASGAKIFSSPLARRLAKEAGLDLSRVTGSGPHGRVVARDIEDSKSGKGVTKPAVAAASAASAPVAASMSDKQILGLYEEGSYDFAPHDQMRKIIAQRLTASTQTVPHFYLTMDCNIGRLLSAREEINAAAPKDKDGKPAYKLSVNDFVIKALAVALQRVPEANVSWTEGGMLKHRHSDIGVAVALPGGLITPIIRQAELKSLSLIANEGKDLITRARVKKLKPHEFQGGTSSVSNLGMYGIKDFTAVINPPQSTILAVGAGEERAIVKNGQIVPAHIMSVTLSCDHRSVDGALGAELIGAFKKLIENPVMMIV